MPFLASRSLTVGLLALVVAGCASAQTPPVAPPAGPPPRLIVFITVDQLRADMLDRYRSELRYGYARLLKGARFTNAFQDHAITETAPGHASTMSGRFPSSTGIISNSDGVIDSRYSLLNGAPTEIGASPERFFGTTLTDWLTARDPRTRALSVSTKDRGAILPIGLSKQDVYWYSENGSYTTSHYYRDTLPTWVAAFNARRIPQRYAGATWSLSRDASTYAEPDSVRWEKAGDNVFPHHIPADTAAATIYLRATPTIDSITALFALEGLARTGIGRGPHTDVMAVSFSGTDYVGHAFGPDSREAHENEIRLDQTLGWFLDSLYKLRDSTTVTIALTGDHGITPIPELARERGEAKGEEGLRINLRGLASAVRQSIREAGGDPTAFDYDQETVALNREALKRAGVVPDSVLSLFTRMAKRIPGVARVDRIASLRKASFTKDPIARRWAHQIPEASPIELVITLTPYSYWNNAVSTHGSPYDRDASVPIIFYGPWVKPGVYTAFTRTVDIGTTLAAIAGVKPLERVDGVVLKEIIR